MSMSASKNLHGQMFEKILRAPPIFFDKNPSGTILNRFSKDMGAMDEMLPQTNLDVLWLFTGTMCVFFIVIYVRPLVVIPTGKHKYTKVISNFLIIFTSKYSPNLKFAFFFSYRWSSILPLTKILFEDFQIS